MVHEQGRLPASPGAAPPRRGGSGDQLGGEGRPGQPARRRLPRHRQPPHSRGDPASPAFDVPPVQAARRHRHHDDADGGRPDVPLRHGRRPRRGRHRGDDRRRPLCRRRGGRGHARFEPARGQLALGPHRVRPSGGKLGRRACPFALGHRSDLRSPGRRSNPAGDCPTSTTRAPRTPTPCTATCKRRCSRSSA